MAKSFDLLIPVRTVRRAAGRLKLPRVVTLAGLPADALGLGKTADLLAGLRLAAQCIVGDDAVAHLRVVRDEAVTHAEGYRLTVAPQAVTVAARTDAGAYYGLATLRGLLRAHGPAIPCQSIDDQPAFPRRAVYLDTARGKVPRLATLKDLADRLAEWKINELQIYVENAFAFRKHAAIAKGYSPLTPAEMTALGAHCKARHVRLVGSLASFGHMEKALRLPQYAPLNELPDGSTLCPTDPASLRFVEELFEEFLPLFEAADFNACCDETWDLGRGRSREACRRRGTGRVYLDFLLKIRKLCRKHGKRMNAWADIILDHPELLDDTPRDMVMCNWGYAGRDQRLARSGEIAAAGLPLMVCPGTAAWNAVGSRWPEAAENICFAAEQGAAHAAEGLLNTDWGDNGHRQMLATSLMAFALGAAESWNPGAAAVDRFPRTFALHAFGDRGGALGDAIDALGRTYLHYDQVGNRDPMYFNLDEPLDWGEGNALWYNRQRRLSRYTPDQLAAVLSSLPPAKAFDVVQAEPFEALALAEYAFTARLTAVYCLRSSLAWRLGLGDRPRSGEFAALAEALHQAELDFRALWLARNKPSRLSDNLKKFRAAAREAGRLAKQ